MWILCLDLATRSTLSLRLERAGVEGTGLIHPQPSRCELLLDPEATMWTVRVKGTCSEETKRCEELGESASTAKKVCPGWGWGGGRGTWVCLPALPEPAPRSSAVTQQSRGLQVCVSHGLWVLLRLASLGPLAVFLGRRCLCCSSCLKRVVSRSEYPCP